MENLQGDEYDNLFRIAITAVQSGEHPEEIKNILSESCDDIILITVVIREARNKHFAAQRKAGFTLVLAGGFVCLCGLLVTFINLDSNQNIELALYGLTTLGLMIAFFGVYKIIG
jgi:hypothetical protein